ncbi:MAG TPA: dihydroneopterin aldolase [Caulobacteraceae bacterium]|jgi:dihydroneopterin aldolase
MAIRTTVFVWGLRLEAEIGVHAHEHGRTQPLLVDIEVEIAAAGAEQLSQTLDYVTLADKARKVAADGHLKLAEAFAERLARACLEDPRALGVTVRVEKPEALAPQAAGAGAEVTLTRG